MKSNNDLKINKELDTVCIDSSGKRHLNYIDARCAEAQIFMCKERKLQQRKRIMETIELIMQVLKSKNWGIYYKIQPIQPLETQDGTALYKVNQVDEQEIEKVIEEALAWDTQKTNPISNQSKNSTTG